MSSAALVICKFWLHIRNLHAIINLDFILQCIYTIMVIVKFVPLVVQVAKVVEKHFTTWQYSNTSLNTIFHDQILFIRILQKWCKCTAILRMSLSHLLWHWSHKSVGQSSVDSVNALQIEVGKFFSVDSEYAFRTNILPMLLLISIPSI